MNLPDRRSIRLAGYDYTQSGAYFFTLCAFQRECLFGEIESGEMKLAPAGEVVAACWHMLPKHFENVTLDAFVIMPNHVHGVLLIDNPHKSSSEPDTPWRSAPSGSLSAILQSFKSVTTRRMNRIRRTPGATIWQRNYYERIVRDEAELLAVRRYILENPLRWPDDKNHPNNRHPTPNP